MPGKQRVMAVRFKFRQKHVEVITMGKSPRGTPFIYNAVRFPRETHNKKKKQVALKQAVDSLMAPAKAV